MLTAVLFDLDGTLLDIDIDAFMQRYLAALSRYTESLYPGGDVMAGVFAGTEAMMAPHPGRTNRDVFAEAFLGRTGMDLAGRWDVFQRFYESEFDALKGDASPREGALEALDAAIGLGLKVAVATNPLFPRIAVRKRMEWAGVDGRPVDLVTTYEEAVACKPHPDYYLQIAERLDVTPPACLMVGDDPRLDLPAADVGMRTYYVGSGRDVGADYTGDLVQLAGLLPRLVERV